MWVIGPGGMYMQPLLLPVPSWLSSKLELHAVALWSLESYHRNTSVHHYKVHLATINLSMLNLFWVCGGVGVNRTLYPWRHQGTCLSDDDSLTTLSRAYSPRKCFKVGLLAFEAHILLLNNQLTCWSCSKEACRVLLSHTLNGRSSCGSRIMITYTMCSWCVSNDKTLFVSSTESIKEVVRCMHGVHLWHNDCVLHDCIYTLMSCPAVSAEELRYNCT